MSNQQQKSAVGTSKQRILVVDDDPIVAESLVELMGREGHQVASAPNGEEGLSVLGASEFDVVICDVALPGINGLAVLREAKRARSGAAFVMLTGYGSIESAVEALRLGATDYIIKPVVDKELHVALERAFQQRAILAENQTLRRRLDSRLSLGNIVGADRRMQKVYEIVEAVAPSRTTVLMTGESGTGKSLIAHAIHHHSPRKDKPFVEISCGSIPETLLESELFGHVKGAFTGAHVDKVGRFLAAEGGTIFLDEINSASPGMQLKLLRVLQERKFEPVGATQTVEVNVRVILASNQPLEQMVAAGTFRQDLYYRINVVKIEVPPLRERLSDIQPLAEHFLTKHAADLGKQLVGFSPEAVDALRRYAYAGNVRELQNIVERAAVLCRGQVIGIDDLPAQVSAETATLTLAGTQVAAASADQPWVPISLEEALKEPERRILTKALEANAWNRQKTADQLQINRTTLYKKMKTLGLEGSEKMAG
jgi:DNA-binding NtrC family response regulator